MREISFLSKQIRLEEAVDLDVKVRLAGDKKGNKNLSSVLAEYNEAHDKEELASINTNEAIKKNRDLIGNIEGLIAKDL